MATELDLGSLGFDRGAHLLVKRALAASGQVHVRGTHPELLPHLRAWARSQGHALDGHTVTRGRADRWTGATRAGTAAPDGVVAHPEASWGFAARGALVEAGTAPQPFALHARDEVWTDDAARLYAQAAAAQWDPASIPWEDPGLDPEVEAAVVQVFTYLIENETAALLVPARFLGQLHPHFREVAQVLAIQVADEARHIEVFTRRAALRGPLLGSSTASGQASLGTLLAEPDFALAGFLLAVLGEGSFLSLLRFLAEHGDPLTRTITRLAAQDEARHVAFGLSHLQAHLRADPALRARLVAAVEGRHDALRDTAGLNADVFDSLVVLAAGSFAPGALARGWDAVARLVAEMDHGRRVRLETLGFGDDEAARLSALHTRNFM